jgi:hypothetical protein
LNVGWFSFKYCRFAFDPSTYFLERGWIEFALDTNSSGANNGAAYTAAQ